MSTGSGRRALVADAAGNDLLLLRRDGRLRLVAVLPDELVPTASAKRIVGCPNPPDPANAPLCGLPARLPAEPVPTSVAVGPDGAFYVGELKGFPFAPGQSRVWRIERDARGTRCPSAKCRVVVDGLTSVIDLRFRGQTLYVAQSDDASVFALEAGQPTGGSVRACSVQTGRCRAVASGADPHGDHVRRARRPVGTVLSLVPGQADVVRLRERFAPIRMPAAGVRIGSTAARG